MSFLNQILYPETCDASRFVESLELPIKLQGCGVLSTRGFTRSVFYKTSNIVHVQCTLYKLLVGQAPSWTMIEASEDSEDNSSVEILKKYKSTDYL